MVDTIIIKSGEEPLFVPREAASDPDYIKHVYCEGARFHVKSWDTFGTRCSEPKCILNKYYNKRKNEGKKARWAVLD